VFDGVMVNIDEALLILFFISEGVFIKSFLPYGLGASFVSTCGLLYVCIKLFVTVCRKMILDSPNDFRVIGGYVWGDNHVDVVWQYDNSIDNIRVLGFAHPKAFA